MDELSCIIIEDEPLAMERTVAFVNKVPFLSLKGTFDNALTGLTFLNQNQIDILFLDINMDELSGIELLENSKISSEVIITTAYPQFALKGYELSVTDYLLKPFTFERFLASINKVQEKISSRKSDESTDFIFIKTENRLEKIPLDEILFIEGMRDYRRIHTITKKVMTLQNFKDLQVLIPRNQICRVHKSFMVSISKIDSIERSRIYIEKNSIPISDTYRESFFDLIKS